MPFTISITSKQKEQLYSEMEDALSLIQSDRREFDRRRVAIYNASRNRVRPKSDPWPGCANTSMPIIPRAYERTAIQTMQTVAPRGSFAKVQAVPVGGNVLEDEAEAAKRTSEYLGYYFRSRMRLSRRIDPYIRSMILYGNAYGIMWWERKERMTRRLEHREAWNMVEKDPEQLQQEQQENPEAEQFERIQVPVEESMDDLLRNKPRVTSVSIPASDKRGIAKRYSYYDDVLKMLRKVDVEGYYDEESEENVILQTGREVVKNQPRFDHVELDDIYFSSEADSVLKSRFVFIRHSEYKLSDIEQRFRKGVFRDMSKEDMESVRAVVPKDELTGVEEGEITAHTHLDRKSPNVKDRADVVEGIQTTRRSRLEVWETFISVDLDGDGEDEELVVWFERESRTILRVAHLYEDYYTNERPIVESTLIPVGNRVMGIGFGEQLMPLANEMNMSVNNRRDAADLALNPGGWYRPGAGLVNGPLRRKPGHWQPIDNPQADVREYTAVPNARDSVQIEAFIMSFAEDLTVGGFTTGGGISRPNAPRTARGTLALIQQDAIKMDYILMRLMPALERICHLTISMLRENAPDGESFRVTGSTKPMQITKEDLRLGYTFFFDLDSVSANKEVERIFATQAMQGAMPIAMLPPERVPAGARKLARRFLSSYEVSNPESIIPDPPGFQRPPQDQMDEIFVMLKGIPVEPVMQDDQMSHIGDMDVFEGTPQFNQMPVEWVEGIWRPHKQGHVIFQQQLERQQAEALQGMAGGPGSAQGAGGANNGVAGLGALAGDALAAEALGSTMSGGNDAAI